MKWVSTKDKLPEDGKYVLTKIDDENGCRNIQLMRVDTSVNQLWFLDGGIYGYYKPTHWLDESSEMEDLNNWKEVMIKGIYTYVADIKNGVWYEIHINRRFVDESVLTAQATLYIVGNWKPTSVEGEPTRDYFSREVLLSNKTVNQCIEAAVRDDKDRIIKTSVVLDLLN